MNTPASPANLPRRALRRLARLLPLSWQSGAQPAQPVPPEAAREAGLKLKQDCYLCKQPRTRHQVLGHVTATQRGAFATRDHRLVRCEACDVVYLSPPPTPHDLQIMYEESIQFTSPTYTDAERVRLIVENMDNALSRFSIYPAAGEACLEVGAGRAWAARACKQHDQGIRTVAQDVTDECAKECPWVDSYVVGTVDAVPRDEKFMLISLTHVIEHLLEPRQMLMDLAGRLKPGGHIYVTAPFRPPGWEPKQGIGPWLGYSYLHVPAHVSYLSKLWFEAASREAGLTLKSWDPTQDSYQAFEAVMQKL